MYTREGEGYLSRIVNSTAGKDISVEMYSWGGEESYAEMYSWEGDGCLCGSVQLKKRGMSL